LKSKLCQSLVTVLAALWLLACGPALAQVAPSAGGEILPGGPSPQFSLPTVEDFMASLIADNIKLRARLLQLEQMVERGECWPRPLESGGTEQKLNDVDHTGAVLGKWSHVRGHLK
jgi:hypothetical protein